MGYIYILSKESNPGEYKIGYHSGTKEKLINRYITSIHDLIIHHFIQVEDHKAEEKRLHSKLSEYRIKNSNGNPCEWFRCPLSVIEQHLKHLSVLEFEKLSISTTVIENFSNTVGKEENTQKQVRPKSTFLYLDKTSSEYLVGNKDHYNSSQHYPIAFIGKFVHLDRSIKIDSSNPEFLGKSLDKYVNNRQEYKNYVFRLYHQDNNYVACDHPILLGFGYNKGSVLFTCRVNNSHMVITKENVEEYIHPDDRNMMISYLNDPRSVVPDKRWYLEHIEAFNRIDRMYNTGLIVNINKENCNIDSIYLERVKEGTCPISGRVHSHERATITRQGYMFSFSCDAGCALFIEGQKRKYIDVTPWTGDTVHDLALVAKHDIDNMYRSTGNGN